MTEPSPSPGPWFTALRLLLVRPPHHLQGFFFLCPLVTFRLYQERPGFSQSVTGGFESALIPTTWGPLGYPGLFHVSVLRFHPAQDSPPFPSAGRRQEDSQVMVYSALRIPPED